jgi:hypothetical protein
MRATIGFVIAVSLSGCVPFGPTVQVAIEFDAPKDTMPLNYIEMMSGADKVIVTNIKPGTVDITKIHPSDSEMNEVGLVIYLKPGNKESTSWTGARFPLGSSYKTHIRIDEKGKVLSQRSCVMPCEL